MDLTQLANLGEFVGGVAVLVTLVYLAVQMRQSNEQARRANSIERSSAYREISRDLMQVQVEMREPELVEIFRRVLVDFECLTNNEKSSIHYRYLGPTTVHMTSIFQAAREELIDEDFSGRWLLFYVSLVKAPGMRVFWQQLQAYLQPAFVEEIERLRSDPSTPPAAHEVFPWLVPDEGTR